MLDKNLLGDNQFLGGTEPYTIISTARGVEWGFRASLENPNLLIRFAMRGLTPAAPTHFNPRIPGSFVLQGGRKPGMYLDKLWVPIYKSRVEGKLLQQTCEDLELPSLLAEWVERQCKLEGIDLLPGINIADLFSAAIDAMPSLQPPELVFVIPKDVVNVGVTGGSHA